MYLSSCSFSYPVPTLHTYCFLSHYNTRKFLSIIDEFILASPLINRFILEKKYFYLKVSFFSIHDLESRITRLRQHCPKILIMNASILIWTSIFLLIISILIGFYFQKSELDSPSLIGMLSFI